MSASVSPSVPASSGRATRPLPFRPLLTYGGPLIVGALCFGILALAQQASAQLAIYWVFGLSLGAILQRGRFCFAGAFRDLFLMRNGTMMRAILFGLAITTVAFTLIQARAVPNPSFGATPDGAHVVPAGLNLAVGGLLFGIGMVVAGGCVSGTLYRIGEGYLASWASLIGILVGLSLAAHTWNWWWAVTIRNAPSVWLPSTLGYSGAVILTLALLGAAALAIMWWESRSSSIPPFVLPAQNPSSFGPATLRDRLNRLRVAVLVKGWSPLAAAGALSALEVCAYLVDHPLGVTGELASWADRAAGVAGLQAPPLDGAAALQGCNLVLEKLGLINNFTLLDSGLIVGALLAALLAGEFKVRAPRQKRRYLQSASGGLLMGYGAGIGVGCTIGAFFSAIPSLGLNGWIFGLALLAGAGVGTQVIRRIA